MSLLTSNLVQKNVLEDVLLMITCHQISFKVHNIGFEWKFYDKVPHILKHKHHKLYFYAPCGWKERIRVKIK